MAVTLFTIGVFLALGFTIDEVRAIPCSIGQQTHPSEPHKPLWVIQTDDPCRCSKLILGGFSDRTSDNYFKTDKTLLLSNDFKKIQAWIDCPSVPDECSSETDGPLGMENRAIPDSSLTASSVFLDFVDVAGPQRARLNFAETLGAAWSAASDDPAPWIEVEFEADVYVTGVVTQGRGDASQWVETFSVEYKELGGSWQQVRAVTGAPKFPGNSDQNTHVTNHFPDVMRARSVRILPLTWQNLCSMRFEVLGCKV